MTVFKYRGFDSSGKILNGRLAAENDRHAHSLLLSATLRGIVAQRLVRRLCLSFRRVYSCLDTADAWLYIDLRARVASVRGHDEEEIAGALIRS